MKKTLLRLFVVILSVLLLVWLIFYTDSFDELVQVARHAKAQWIFAGFGCMVVYWAIDAVVLNRVTCTMMERQPLKNTIRVTMIGQFFNSITPLAGAGQPVQAYVMVKDGVSPGRAISVFIIKTVLHQSVIILYSIAAFMLRGNDFAARLPRFYYFFLAGILLNGAFMVLNLILLYDRKTSEKLLSAVFKLIRRFRFIKDPDAAAEKLREELDGFAESAAALKKNKGAVVMLVFLQALQFTFIFAIPYFIQLATEPQRASFPDVIASQAVTMLISMLVPTPGATGGIEGLSYLFYGMFFRKGYIVPAILIYRILTYYSSLIFGGLFTLLAPEKPLKRETS